MNIAKCITSNSEQSYDGNCTNCINFTTVFYADNNGTMITYPYYIGDPMYENDQCTDYKILYDPRIKPVSKYVNMLYVCRRILNHTLLQIEYYSSYIYMKIMFQPLYYIQYIEVYIPTCKAVAIHTDPYE